MESLLSSLGCCRLNGSEGWMGIGSRSECFGGGGRWGRRLLIVLQFWVLGFVVLKVKMVCKLHPYISQAQAGRTLADKVGSVERADPTATRPASTTYPLTRPRTSRRSLPRCPVQSSPVAIEATPEVRERLEGEGEGEGGG